MKYKKIKVAQILCGIYILGMTFAPVGSLGMFGGALSSSGLIIDPNSDQNTKDGVILWNSSLRAIVASTNLEMILLGISRFSGFSMYPALILCFFTKFRGTCAALGGTTTSWFQNMHDLHIYSGWVIVLDSCIHVFCHLLRWILQWNLRLLLNHRSGITGLIIVVSTFVVCLPMILWKDRIKYEARKLCHYLFLVFGVAMCFHAPASALPNGGFSAYIFPSILSWYFLDLLYCFLFMTEVVNEPRFEILDDKCGVQITLPVSDRFQHFGSKKVGYSYLCIPEISRIEWHAFSTYQNPKNGKEHQIFMQCTGDWTRQVQKLISEGRKLTVWIQGLFPSPFQNSVRYRHLVLMAAGVGITPALSVLHQQEHEEQESASSFLHLIWVVREIGMIDFFIRNAHLDYNRCGCIDIYFTGRIPLPTHLLDMTDGSSIRIHHHRPNLRAIMMSNTVLLDAKQEEHHFGMSNYGGGEPTLTRGLGKVIIFSNEHVTYDSELMVSINSRTHNDDTQKPEADESCSSRATITLEESHDSDEHESDTPHEDVEVGLAICSPGQLQQATPTVKIERNEWGIMYCGGNGSLLRDVTAISLEFGIKLHKESFRW